LSVCLIVLAWQTDAHYPLILAANRDEFHERPSQAAHWWDSPAGLFAGRDLRDCGTWLGADRQGRFAAITNVREKSASSREHSRGELVACYFATQTDAAGWARQVARVCHNYAPFNLLVGDRNQ